MCLAQTDRFRVPQEQRLRPTELDELECELGVILFIISISIVDTYIMSKTDNLQGSLELLVVMKILRRGPNHGFAMASYIQQTSETAILRALGRFALSGSTSNDGSRPSQGRVADVRTQDGARGSMHSPQRGAASSQRMRRNGAPCPRPWRRFFARSDGRMPSWGCGPG